MSTRRLLHLSAAVSTLGLFALAQPARAQNMQLPNVPLPASEKTVTSLWGTQASLAARISGASSGPHYLSVKSDVDGALSGLLSNPAAYTDDQLAGWAKEAALLAALGATPASGSPTAYHDAAVAALTHIQTRTTESLLGGGSNQIDILEDSPRLQSMAEAYDLLRSGGGIDPTDDAEIRGNIDAWCNALVSDYNLETLGIYPHLDNWGLKAGSALITAALSLSAHPDASSWLAFGDTLASKSIQNVGSTAGWYRESAHYLNYALDDLFSTAVQVQNVTGVDWLTPLKPFAQAALDLRQPDGREAPFEEGVPCVFPFDVFAPYYADLGGQLVWAFNHSNQDTDSYPNQQPVEATRYLAGELPAETAPSGRDSRFANGDAHISALRSGWDTNAVQATLFAARDYEDESGALISSYHDMNNPLDLEIAGNGSVLLPTSGGGPEVTSSSDRSYYLKASSKNVPLVNGGAPWITDANKISSDLQLAGQDELGLSGRYLDLSRATVSGAYTTPVTAVARTMALIGGQYVAVIDEMDTQPGGTSTLDVALHGRGSRTVIDSLNSPLRMSWAYNNGDTTSALDSFTVGSSTPTLALTDGGVYADSYGATEEEIDGVQLQVSATASRPFARTITILDPRSSSAGALTVTDRTQSGTAIPGLLAVSVAQDAMVDHIATAPQPYVLETDGGVALSDAGTAITNIDGVSTDGIFSAVREVNGAVTAFGVGSATELSFGGNPLLVSGTPITLSFNESPSTDGGTAAAGYIGELSPDITGTTSFAVHGIAGFDPGLPYAATYQEQPIGAPNFIQLPDGFQFGALSSAGTGGTIAVVPNGPEILAPIPAQAVAEGQLLTFTLPATAPAGSTLTFSYNSLTTFETGTAPALDPATGVFSWTPDYNIASAAGPTNVVINFVASTGTLSVTRACIITVTDVDRGPVLAAVPNAIVRRLTTYSLQLAATDADGYPITYAWQPLHGFPSPTPSFDPIHGTFTWNCPATAPLGVNQITFSANDGHVTSSQTMQLTVQDVNHPPVFVSVNSVALADPTMYLDNVTAGTPISLTFLAHDPDADPLTFTARQPRGDLPDGAVFVPSTATLTWTPTAEGQTIIIVKVDDNWGGEAQLQVTINVTAPSGCTSGGAPGAFAMLLGLLLVLRSRRRSPRAI